MLICCCDLLAFVYMYSILYSVDRNGAHMISVCTFTKQQWKMVSYIHQILWTLYIYKEFVFMFRKMNLMERFDFILLIHFFTFYTKIYIYIYIMQYFFSLLCVLLTVTFREPKSFCTAVKQCAYLATLKPCSNNISGYGIYISVHRQVLNFSFE